MRARYHGEQSPIRERSVMAEGRGPTKPDVRVHVRHID